VVSFLTDSDEEQDGVEPANNYADDCTKAVHAELEAYLSKLASDKWVYPLKWWSVSAVAHCILSIPVTIVP